MKLPKGINRHLTGSAEQRRISDAIEALRKSHEIARDDPWARRGVIATIFYTLLTVLIFGASIYTAYEATIATNASVKQAFIAEDTEHRQLRAYVGPYNVGAHINSFRPPSVPNIQVNLRNYGQTPALNARVESSFYLKNYPLPKNFDYATSVQVKNPNPLTIFSGDNDTSSITATFPRTMSDDEFAAFQDGSHARVYFWGSVHYDDIFGSPHYVNFCYMLYDQMDIGVKSEPCDNHNDSD